MTKTTSKNKPKDLSDPASWDPETQLVHGGVLRSQFGETSEALFLTQGYVYTSAEQAEARFKNEDPGFQYTRFSNPDRLHVRGAHPPARRRRGLPAPPPPAWRPSPRRLLSFLKAGDHVVAARAMFGSCRYIVETLCPRFGIAATLIDGRDVEAWKAAVRPNTRGFFFETPANPTLDLVDIAAVEQDRQGERHHHRGRQRLRHAHAAAADGPRRRRRRLFRNQAHRRPGPLPRRRCAVLAEVPHRPSAGLHPPDRPVHEPVQCLGHAQGPRDAAAARPRPKRHCGRDCRLPRRAEGRGEGHLLRPRRPSAGRARRQADDAAVAR